MKELTAERDDLVKQRDELAATLKKTGKNFRVKRDTDRVKGILADTKVKGSAKDSIESRQNADQLGS